MNNVSESSIAASPMRVILTIMCFAQTPEYTVQMNLHLTPFKKRILDRCVELNAMRDGIGKEKGLQRHSHSILLAYGLESNSYKATPADRKMESVIAKNLQTKTKFRKCGNCYVEETLTKHHKVCSGCKTARYCSAECASLDWKKQTRVQKK